MLSDGGPGPQSGATQAPAGVGAGMAPAHEVSGASLCFGCSSGRPRRLRTGNVPLSPGPGRRRRVAPNRGLPPTHFAHRVKGWSWAKGRGGPQVTISWLLLSLSLSLRYLQALQDALGYGVAHAEEPPCPKGPGQRQRCPNVPPAGSLPAPLCQGVFGSTRADSTADNGGARGQRCFSGA